MSQSILEQLATSAPANEGLDAARAAGRESFATHGGLPSKRSEAWRYTPTDTLNIPRPSRRMLHICRS